MDETKNKPGSQPGALPPLSPPHMPDMPGAASRSAKSLPTKIEVVATGKGFYRQQRIKEGDRFVVEKFDQLASYMKCVDPVIEKMRVQLMEERKRKAKAGSV